MKKTKYESYLVNKLPKGCSLCPNGKKSVLYITGLCPNHCFYCPLSDTRNQVDKVWINEKEVEDTYDIKKTIEEIKLCKSKGVGITGGEPLVKLDRTLEYIKELKKTFGKKFHIHMYTTMKLLTLEKIELLYEAGLDELRVHPMIENLLEIKSILTLKLLALKKLYNKSFGIEIPIIPDKKEEIKYLIKLIYGYADFINLNELEISDNNSNNILGYGYETSSEYAYSIKGSLGAGIDILKFIESENKKNKKHNLSAHLCTCKLKDSHQLKNRLKNRANSIKTKYDKIIDDFMLERFVIYPKELSLDKTKKERDEIVTQKNEDIKNHLNNFSNLLKELKIDHIIDDNLHRIVFNKNKIDLIKNKLNGLDFLIYKVIEYPSSDFTMIESEIV